MLLYMPAVVFTTPCCTFRSWCLRPIHTKAFIEDFTLVSSLIFIFTEAFICWCFYWKASLVSSLLFIFTIAFIGIFNLVSSLITNYLPLSKTQSLFYSKLHPSCLNTFSAFAWFISPLPGTASVGPATLLVWASPTSPSSWDWICQPHSPVSCHQISLHKP